MPYKDLEVRKAYHKEQSRKHYEANKEAVIQKTADKKKAFRIEWQEYKATLACTKCGFSHSAALDFHHENPEEKEYNIHRLLSNGQYAKLHKELKKCIVLCANCHRIHHYDEKTLQSQPKTLQNLLNSTQ
jgi:predicted nucleic-acid-binding Zn-ribbon protein